MKRLPLVLNLVLAVAVVVLYILHFSGSGASTGRNHADSTGAVVPGTGIAYIDIDTLLNSYDRLFEMRTELETKGSQLESDLKYKTQRFQSKVADFQTKVQKGLLLRSEIQKLQEELGAEEQQLNQLNYEYNQKFAEEQQVMVRQLYEDMVSFLKEYNKDHNYQYILGYQYGQNNLLYGDQGMNITMDVLRGMNQKYKTSSKEKK